MARTFFSKTVIYMALVCYTLNTAFFIPYMYLYKLRAASFTKKYVMETRNCIHKAKNLSVPNAVFYYV